jgi:hypothetical protein
VLEGLEGGEGAVVETLGRGEIAEEAGAFVAEIDKGALGRGVAEGFVDQGPALVGGGLVMVALGGEEGADAVDHSV